MKRRSFTRKTYLDALQHRILVFDGAMGTSLQALNLDPADYGAKVYEGCIDYLSVTRPEVIEGVHRSFLEVGVDVIETNTFRANRITLNEYQLGDRVHEINQAAASLARRVADEYSRDGRPRFVAGVMGPTGKLPSADDPDLSDISFEALSEIFREQSTALIQGGVELLLIETSQDLLEVKAAIHGIGRAFVETGETLPVQAQVTLDTNGRMLLGTDVGAALTSLERLDIDVIGLNCSTGPEHMREPIAFLGEHASLPVSCIPNAGLPLNIDGEAVYPLEPEPYVADMLRFVEKHGVRVVGGCCGTTPQHLKLLVEALQGRNLEAQTRLAEPNLASAMRAISLIQVPPPLLIGERINTQGSRLAKRLLLAEDYDALVALARQQVESGAHALDICIALTERDDEAEMMQQVVKLLSMNVDAPLVIDTTEPGVMEAALMTAPGRCILNSVNLENGRDKLDQVLSLARAYGAAVIALTIDEQGMAKTVERKLSIAHRISDIAVGEFGLAADSLIFDTLTFTLSTGDKAFADSAVETLEAIRQVKVQLPGVLTSLGVSNVSFGFSPQSRPVLNSVMLYHAVQAGLDMAIVNPAHIRPYSELPEEGKRLAEDLLFNRNPTALEKFIDYFEAVDLGSDPDPIDPTEGMTVEERLHWRILHRHKEGVEADIDEILDRHAAEERAATAVTILNQVLLPAMKEVGDKFGAGELILPFVLQSAEVMKKSVTYLENFLERREGTSKGKVILATVYGDVHDIGKNLVKTILSNNGYQVHDLGKQVPANVIIEAAVEQKADAVGLSALLVSTSKQMPLIVNELDRRGLEIPVLIGGAAINRRFGRRILYTEDDLPYGSGVFYCKDAFEGLSVMDQLQDPNQRNLLLEQRRQEAERERAVKTTVTRTSATSKRRVTDSPIPTPPAWGARVVEDMPLDLVFKQLYKNELFRLSWGGKNTHGEEWEAMRADFEERLGLMQQEAKQSGWLKPQGVYGYWPTNASGDELILYAPERITNGELVELTRFRFPRQPSGEGLCLADYFRPASSGVLDVVALQVVTVGFQATERVDSLQQAGEYTESYFSHGLAVQLAEAAAEYLHRHIRKELGLPEGQGKRYSWGYPAIPDLDDHPKVFKLLPAADALGMSLSPAHQLIPEQSTAAIIIHHPHAKYFNVGVSRVEQLTGDR